MNNWQYANGIPTSPWRSAMSVPREVGLERRDGEIELVQSPVRQLRRLHTGRPFRARGRVPEGTWTLERASGTTLDIEAEFEPETADRFGLELLAGDGEKTIAGYDAEAGELYVDRTQSGRTDFSRSVANAVQRAPLAARRGEIELRILVDRSSVEVFADDGRRVITDQVFTSPGSDGVRLFAEAGGVRLERLEVRRMAAAT